jgi:hypothetical protein
VKHGRHFTLKGSLVEKEPISADGTVITFVSKEVEKSWVNPRFPYASRGPWLHVLLSDALAEKVEAAVSAVLAACQEVSRIAKLNCIVRNHCDIIQLTNCFFLQPSFLPKTLLFREDKLTITIAPDVVSSPSGAAARRRRLQ